MLASVWSGTKWHQVAHSVLARIWSGTKWHTQCWQVFEVAPSGTKWHTQCWHVFEVAPSGTRWHSQCWQVFEVAPSKWHQVAHSLSPFGAEWLWVAPNQVALSGSEWHQVAHSLPPSGSKVWSRARSIRGIGWIERALDHILSILRRMNVPYLRTKWRWVALSGTKWHTHCHQVAAKSGPEPVLSEGLGG